MKKNLIFLILLGGAAVFLFLKIHSQSPAPVTIPSESSLPTESVPPHHETTASEKSSGANSIVSAEAAKSVSMLGAGLNKADQQKLQVLSEILNTKNDNDPRFDTELNVLSPALKHAITQYYHQFPLEKLNERGTIAFLIARNITETADVDFLKSVLMEKPCLSLSDCSKPSEATHGAETHLDGLNETTANYPQLTAIQQMADSYRRIMNDPNANQMMAAEILEALRESAQSPNPRIAAAAKQAAHSLKQ